MREGGEISLAPVPQQATSLRTLRFTAPRPVHSDCYLTAVTARCLFIPIVRVALPVVPLEYPDFTRFLLFGLEDTLG